MTTTQSGFPEVRRVWPAFMEALESPDPTEALRIIEQQQDINADHGTGLRLVHLAASMGHKVAIEQLIQRKTNLDIKSNAGSSPLHFAQSKGHKDIADTLAAAGADATATNSQGETPAETGIRMEQTRAAKHAVQASSPKPASPVSVLPFKKISISEQRARGTLYADSDQAPHPSSKP